MFSFFIVLLYNINEREVSMIELKKEIIDYLNREIGEEYTYADFTFENRIPLGYTTTEDEEHELQFEFNTQELVFRKYKDDSIEEEVHFKDKDDAILYIHNLTFEDLTI